jgi:hypothetical protein
MYNQLDYITNERGDIIVDFVGRYENLEHDVNTVIQVLGLKSRALPHVNKSQHRHYSEYYTEETKGLVAERYSRDIDFFRYQFEGTPGAAMPRPPKLAANLSR